MPQAALVRLEADPRPLLAATINLVVREPARLRRHSEVSTAIAEAIEEHARSG